MRVLTNERKVLRVLTNERLQHYLIHVGHEPRLGRQRVVELGESARAVTPTNWERIVKQKVQLKREWELGMINCKLK